MFTSYLKLAALLAVALGLSYGFARVGEPQSEWLWCQVLNVC